jgi:stage II sporulation protein D
VDGQFLPTGRVNDLPDARAQIRAAEVRKAFALRSSYFVTLAQGDSVRFIGKGFGHGVGMCQEGAMNRARHGQSAQDILHTYYTGVRIADLKSMRLLAPAVPDSAAATEILEAP